MVSMVSPDPTSNVIVLLSIVVMKTCIGVLAGVKVAFTVDVICKTVFVGIWVVLSDMLIEAEGNEMNASPEGEGVSVGIGVTIDEEFRALEALIPLLGIEISDDKDASDAVRTALLMSIVELAKRGVDSLVVLNVDTETSLADGSISTKVGVIMNVFEIPEVIDVKIADEFGVVEETSSYVGMTSEEVDVKTEV